MNDIQRRDRQVFLQSLFSPGRVVGSIVLFFIAVAAARLSSLGTALQVGTASLILVTAMAYTAYQRSIPKRFREARFRQHWQACQDRAQRFDAALKAMRKHGLADLSELPTTVRKLLNDLYLALRRADQINYEISVSESMLVAHGSNVRAHPGDAQAQELFRLADKNIAEYRQHMRAVQSAIQRTEGQVVVFTTTMDALRARMLGQRLNGRAAEVDNQEFLASITEAKMQLRAIDEALDELEMTPFPKTISVIPPAIPDHAYARYREEPAETESEKA